MKKFLHVSSRPNGNVVLLSLDVDKIEAVMQETFWKEKRGRTIIFYDGETIIVEEPYDYIMERIKKADEEAKIS